MKPIFGKIENPDHSFLLIKWTDKPNPKFLWHFHHAFELNLVVKGAGMRFIGDHLGHYSAGDLVLMGAELPHTWCSDPALPQRKGVYQSLAVQFNHHFLGDSLLADPEWHHVRSLIKRAARGLSFHGKTRETVRKKVLELTELSGPPKLSCFLGILEALYQSQNGLRKFNHAEITSQQSFQLGFVIFDVLEKLFYFFAEVLSRSVEFILQHLFLHKLPQALDEIQIRCICRQPNYFDSLIFDQTICA